MPRGVRGGGRGGRGAAAAGRVSKSRCVRSLTFPNSASGNAEAVEPTPGPSIDNRVHLVEQLKAFKVAKALDAKKTAKLSPVQKKHLVELKDKKQVGYFMMPDAPESKKGKGKGRNREQDTRVWRPCPLLPGVPPVPPPHVPQPWELAVGVSHDIKEKDDIIKGTTPDLIIPQQMLARVTQSAGTPPRTAPESVMDITDATEQLCPPHNIKIPGPSTANSEIESPTRTPPRKKNRIIQFSPSTGIIQSSVLPQSPVHAEIEVQAITPSSTTSTTTPGSGRSANDFDVDLDIEHEFQDPGEGSDVELEANLTLKPSNFEDDNMLPDPSLAEAIQSIDAEADLALRSVLFPGADQDLLNFEWRCEPENFEGVKETFTVPSGPTFDNKDLTPLEVFLKIWDANIIDHIVRETNRYGNEIVRQNKKPNTRLKRWKDITDVDIKIFFAIIMMQSLVMNNVEREYWYPKLDELKIGDFRAIMPFNKFLMIKRCLHFVDNASLPVHPNKLSKILPIIEHLNIKFSSLYQLEQNIAIDESLLLWKGRLSFSQLISNKKAKVGIKSYELCESRTGYLWRMEVYSGKGHIHVAQVGGREGAQELVVDQEDGDKPESATSQIVLTLMRPLFGRGHTLVMDNFYNAPLLSRILKVKHKTDSMGTLRLNREFVAESLKNKTKFNMKPGEVAFSSTKDLCVVVWMDKNVVPMISTFHRIQVGGKEKYGYYKYKPQVILDYNLSMGGIDHKDQMLHAYSIERVRNCTWYKKLFRRLVNVSIHNSFVMFNHNRKKVLGNREFRLQLAKGLLEMCRPETLPRPLPAQAAANVRCNFSLANAAQMHLPVKNARPQRCKLCNAAKVRRTTVWRCGTCVVNLCIEGCYTSYHKQMYQKHKTQKT